MVAYTIEVRPTVWGGVPRIWEKLKAALEAAIAAEQDAEKRRGDRVGDGDRPPPGRRLHEAGEVPAELQAEWERGRRGGLLQDPGAARARPGRISSLVGAAPTPPDVLEFFLAMGIEICELWGMSETTAIATLNPPGGGAGRHRRPAAPRHRDEARRGRRGAGPRPDRDEGLPQHAGEDGGGDRRRRLAATGDIGEFDEAGYLRIVDRKKELIINAGGKNMSPAQHRGEAEGGLAADRPGGRDRRPPPLQRRPAHARPRIRSPPAAPSPTIPRSQPRSQRAVAAANERLSRVEQIKRFKVLPGEWVPGGEELTPTMKLKRRRSSAATKPRSSRSTPTETQRHRRTDRHRAWRSSAPSS